MYRGERRKLGADIRPGNARFSWTSSNPSVAGISSGGTVTARKCGMAELIIKIKKNGRTYQTALSIHVTYSRFFVNNKLQKKAITKKVRNQYLSDSGFIGNSVSLGLTYYMRTQEKGFMGKPLMLPAGCYSFTNDRGGNPKYRIHYKGKVYPAKKAIRVSGLKKVFICMGTNDLYLGANGAYRAYVNYLKGIRSMNPDVIIYIESTPPAYSYKGNITNKNIDKLNDRIKKYCSRQKDMYYIDIATPLRDHSTGRMARKYSSDKYVHINHHGYRVWTAAICSYIEKQLLQQQTAEDAAITAKEGNVRSDRVLAKKLINSLKNSTFKKDCSTGI